MDNADCAEFAAMLPLTMTMHDLFKRERSGALRAHLGPGTRTSTFEVGDMICWAPGPDLTIFHHQDGQTISGDFHLMGRLDFGAEAFGAPGPLEVSIALATNAAADEGRPR